jgi:acyl transferase domain-containing protein
MMPANLHYESPNPDIPGLVDGRLQVVTDRTPLHGGLMAVNSFGFGGSNVHTAASRANFQKILRGREAPFFVVIISVGLNAAAAYTRNNHACLRHKRFTD